MVEYTLFEKIKTLFIHLYNEPLILLFLLGILVMVIDSFIVSADDKKIKKVYLILTIFLFFLFLEPNFNVFTTVLNNYSNNIISKYYFPSMTEYYGAIVLSTLILIYSFNKHGYNKILKVINAILTSLNYIILLLVVEVINTNSIDHLNKLEVYNNPSLMIMIQLTTISLITITLTNLVYLISNIIYEKQTILIKDELKEVSLDNYNLQDEVVLEPIKETVLPKKKTEKLTKEVIKPLVTIQEEPKEEEIMSASIEEELILPKEKPQFVTEELFFDKVIEKEELPNLFSDLEMSEDILEKPVVEEPTLETTKQIDTTTEVELPKLKDDSKEYTADFTVEEYQTLRQILMQTKNE